MSPVLEKHADFLRDFRGDTVHPTTMRLLDELGLFERFIALPHSKVEQASLEIGGQSVTMVDFRRLRRQPHRSSRWSRSGTCSTSWPTPARQSRRSRSARVTKSPACCVKDLELPGCGTSLPTARVSCAPI